MSQKKVLNTLKNLGLAELDAHVYIFLGKKGPRKGLEISKALKMSKQNVYAALKNLQSKGILTATLEHPAKFSVLSIEKALDLFAKSKMEEARRMEEVKAELLSDWQEISIDEKVDQSPKFSVLEGRNLIYSRLRQMIEDTSSHLSIISSVPDLLRADQFGLFSPAFSHASRTNAKFRFLTEVSEENLKGVKLILERIPRTATNFEGRAPEFGIKLTSRMLIRDDAEVAFFLSHKSDDGVAKEVDDVCLWTNSSAMVKSFTTVFDDLWRNSTAIEKRIAEIETGKPVAKTCFIRDRQAAKEDYVEAIDAALAEIFMVTSSAGLVKLKNIAGLKKRAENGVTIKIMAPITRDNLEAALRLSEYCEVRHVPANYLGTMVVDGKLLFQFKNPPSDGENLDDPLNFENAFYSDDIEYVKKTRGMLDEVWNHAVTPSAFTVEDTMKPRIHTTAPVSDDEYVVSRKDSPYQKMAIGVDEKPMAVTKEYVLNKIINAKRLPCKNPFNNPTRFYGCDATAVIRTPTEFHLPDMIVVFLHCNKQSSFGAEDCFHVYLWLETLNGAAFVPVASAGDNPMSMERRKLVFAGTPASKNIHILEKDELQIKVHGNTLFAGWTVPIPLFPRKYVLPPSSLLFDGYGKIKPDAFTITMPSGTKISLEANNLDAFVTFFHPAMKYSGPGTDGTLARDMIMTVYPPSSMSEV